MKLVKPERSIESSAQIFSRKSFSNGRGRVFKSVFNNHELFSELKREELDEVSKFFQFFMNYEEKLEFSVDFRDIVYDVPFRGWNGGQHNDQAYDAVGVIFKALERESWRKRYQLVARSVENMEHRYRLAIRHLGIRQSMIKELVVENDKLEDNLRMQYNIRIKQQRELDKIKHPHRYVTGKNNLNRKKNKLNKNQKSTIKALLNTIVKKNEKMNEDPKNWITHIHMERLHGMDCHYCGLPASESNGTEEYRYNGIDRKDSSRGYIKGNVVSCCRTCNTVKMDKSYEEFIAMYRGWAERVLDKTK